VFSRYDSAHITSPCVRLTWLPYQFVPVASFASSILSSKDHPSLVIGALQLVDLLLTKVPEEYKPTFRREGVFHEIETLAARSITKPKEKEKEKEKETSEAPSSSEAGNASPTPTPAPVSAITTIPGFKKLTSLALDPEDAITLRARVIQFKHLAAGEGDDGDNAFNRLKGLVERLSSADATEKGLALVLQELAELFMSPHTSVSSFELLQSGFVDGLLLFSTDPERNG
jgi:E3 ubiquitin-protein ligase TRIP12